MKKILIIEDEKDIRETLKDILEMKNYRVILAADGHEGLIKTLKEKPDLIISDVFMPGFDGFQLLEHLSQSTESENIPLIFLTAKTQLEDFRTGLGLGAVDYITKPFKTKDLLDSVEKQLKKIDQHKEREVSYFKLAFDNPFTGVFYLVDDRIVKMNKTFSDITEYTLNELQDIGLEKIFPNNFSQIQQKISDCTNGLSKHESTKTLLMSKSKKMIDIEFYLKKLNTENALLGIINQSNHHNIETSSEIIEILDYFKDNENNFIVNEINNALKLLNIDKTLQVEKLKSKINLSARELEILELICQGFTNQEIGEKLFISPRTVDNHRAKILEKTNTKNTAELVRFAFKNNIIKL